jgi:hypothetical protein
MARGWASVPGRRALEERSGRCQFDERRQRLWALVTVTPCLAAPDEAAGGGASAHSFGGSAAPDLLVRHDGRNPNVRVAPRQAPRGAGVAALRECRAAPRPAGPHALVANCWPVAGRLVGHVRRRERTGTPPCRGHLGARAPRSVRRLVGALFLQAMERADTEVRRAAPRRPDEGAVPGKPAPRPVASMNTKRKGARNEHRSMALLEAAGYRCTRSAASLGEWDIVGIGTTDIALVEVRTRDWPSLREARPSRSSRPRRMRGSSSTAGSHGRAGRTSRSCEGRT